MSANSSLLDMAGDPHKSLMHRTFKSEGLLTRHSSYVKD
jgi:hypothetical protein